jgi:hypothetical protein
MGARSEKVILTDDGKEVRVLFTNRALAEAESQCGKSIIAISNGFQENKTGVTEVAALLRAGMEAARRDSHTGARAVTLQDAYELMDAAGFTEVVSVVMTAVADVIGYNPKNL